MRAPNVREAFDQSEFMLDGPALRFGTLLGSEKYQPMGPRVAIPSLIYLSICSGEAPCFRVICRSPSLARIHRLQFLGRTNIVHCRHLEILCCSECTERSAEVQYDRSGITI